jgi:WD40 repeat protein
MLNNYYKVGGSLNANHRTYVIRKADTQIFALLQAGEYCFVFNSRQMGKSSLRVQTIKKLKVLGYKCASIDLTILGSHISPEKWYKGFANQLLSSLEIDDLDFYNWWSQHESWTDVQKLNLFFEYVLNLFNTKIVIFIDEIDTLIKSDFKDDFFSLIRACYNLRAESAKYENLTFCLLGVATPGDLIQQRERTPFNIGTSIELTGFTFSEAKDALIPGLANKVEYPEAVLQDVLAWTGGQPFLTQKLCNLIVQETLNYELNVNDLVHQYIIENWEAQDEPEHLRTIRDRLLRNEQKAGRLLGLYQQVLYSETGEILTNSPEETELRLSGLVVKQDGYLKVYNPIYEAIFNRDWVRQELDQLRPYSEAINNWINAQYEPSFLLRGKALETALSWAVGKNLTNTDYEFFQQSQKAATELQITVNQQLTQASQKLRKANQTAKQKLASANKKAKYILWISASIASILILFSVIIGQNQLQTAKEATRLTQIGYNATQQFQSKQLEALILAMQAGQDLKKLVSNQSSLEEYQTITPLSALLNIFANINEFNQFDTEQTGLDSISFSPNGQIIASGSDSGIVKLWQSNGKFITTLKGHQNKINSISFSPDSQVIASASQHGNIKLWHRDGSLTKTISAHSIGVVSAIFTADNNLVSTSKDGKIKFWTLNGNLTKTISLKNPDVTSLATSEDGKTIAVGNEHGNIEIWHSDGSFITSLSGHKGWITSISFSPDGQMIASGSDDKTIKLWQLNGNLINTVQGHTARINTVNFSPDGKLLASGSSDQTVKLWQLNGTLVNTFIGHSDSVASVTWNRDGKTIASASSDGMIKIWKLNPNIFPTFTVNQAAINTLNFSRDGQTIATGSVDGIVKLWKRDGTLLTNLEVHPGSINTISFSQDGKTIAVGTDQQIAKLWRRDGTLINTLTVPEVGVTNFSFSSDNQTIAVGTDQGNIQLWRWDGKLLHTMNGHKNWVTSVAFSPNDKIIASGGDDGIIKLWQTNGTLITTLSGHRKEIKSISFSYDNQILASGSTDQTIKLWRLDGTLIATLTGHNGAVNSVNFSYDNEIVVSGSQDQTIKVWKKDGTPMTTLSGHSSAVPSVNFIPNSQLIASASKDSKVILWSWNLDDLLIRGCQWLQNYFVTHPQDYPSINHFCRRGNNFSARRYANVNS